MLLVFDISQILSHQVACSYHSIIFELIQKLKYQKIVMDPPLVQQQQPSNEGVYFNLQNAQGNNSQSSPTTSLVKKGLAEQARSSFIAKVYLLLSLQMGITFGFCLLSQYSQSYRNFQLDYEWVLVFPVLLLMACIGVAMCMRDKIKFPIDNLLLLVFILSFSYIISFSCSVVAEEIPGPTVVIAIGATVGVVVALTLYAFFCRANFVVLFGVIVVAAVTMFIIGITILFTYSDVMICIYCGLAVLVYGAYLVIVTKMIIGGEIGDFPMDNYILASLFLYIYIVKIFMMILRIVAASKR